MDADLEARLRVVADQQEIHDLLVRSLLERFPDITLATDDFEWFRTFSLHGVRSTPVRLRGGRP